MKVLNDLQPLHHDSKMLLVLPREHRRSHAEQNQCECHNRRNMFSACVHRFSCNWSVDENMKLGLLVADEVLHFDRYHRFCTSF